VAVLDRIRRFIPRRDLLTVESCPLHTEKAEWAAQMPGQVIAAMDRGAHFIFLTETRPPFGKQIQQLATEHGYQFFGALDSNAHATAVLVKKGLKIVSSKNVPSVTNYRTEVTIEFHGRLVTAIAVHWNIALGPKIKQTNELIVAMDEYSKGTGIVIFGGDANPNHPLSVPTGEPQATLAKAGYVTIYKELNHFPQGVGVTIIGRNSKDRAVKANSATIHNPLGSDHSPVFGAYSVKRLRSR
jgi:hypothetical protein